MDESLASRENGNFKDIKHRTKKKKNRTQEGKVFLSTLMIFPKGISEVILIFCLYT